MVTMYVLQDSYYKEKVQATMYSCTVPKWNPQVDNMFRLDFKCTALTRPEKNMVHGDQGNYMLLLLYVTMYSYQQWYGKNGSKKLIAVF